MLLVVKTYSATCHCIFYFMSTCLLIFAVVVFVRLGEFVVAYVYTFILTNRCAFSKTDALFRTIVTLHWARRQLYSYATYESTLLYREIMATYTK